MPRDAWGRHSPSVSTGQKPRTREARTRVSEPTLCLDLGCGVQEDSQVHGS